MNFPDLVLLTKKIAVGIAVTAIPAFLLLTGLWATQHSLDPHRNTIRSITQRKESKKHENGTGYSGTNISQ